MPHREHSQTVNQTDLHSASVTAEGVFELTVLMVNSVFARLVLCPYGCCSVQGTLVTLLSINITRELSILLSCTIFCMVVTVNFVHDVAIYSVIIKYSFVMYNFLHGCNCQLCP